jgi:translation initiation factor 3 subunit D
MRVGYISRVNPADNRRHSILNVDTFRTDKFAEQINLNINNGWGMFGRGYVQAQTNTNAVALQLLSDL